MSERSGAYEKAISYALRLLGFRMRTEKELRDRLIQKGYHPEAEQVINRLKELGYLDDQAYVESYVRSRAKPAGRSRLKYELSQKKGIAKDIVEDTLDLHYTNEQELAAAIQLSGKLWALAQKNSFRKTGELRGYELTSFKKIASKLLARGFSYETVSMALRKIRSQLIEDEI